MTVISPRKSPVFNFSCEYVNHYLKSLASFFFPTVQPLFFFFVIFVLGFLLMCRNGKRHYILGGVYCCFPVPHLAIALLYLPSLSCIYQSSSLFFFLLSFTTPGLFFLSSRLCLNIFVAFPSSSSSPSCPTFLYISLPASAALIAINSPSETLTCGLLLL